MVRSRQYHGLRDEDHIYPGCDIYSPFHHMLLLPLDQRQRNPVVQLGTARQHCVDVVGMRLICRPQHMVVHVSIAALR